MTVSIHGKEYKTVAERVKEFHAKYNKTSITTEMIRFDDQIAIVKARVIVKDNDNTNVYTGHAYEKVGSTAINKTSALENCETSAIGRALASAGFVGTEFASADEVANAIVQQQKEVTTKVESCFISGKQLSDILDIADNLKNADKRKKRILDHLKVPSFNEITTDNYTAVLNILKDAKERDKKEDTK